MYIRIRSVKYGIRNTPSTGGDLICLPQLEESCVSEGKQGSGKPPLLHPPWGGVYENLCNMKTSNPKWFCARLPPSYIQYVQGKYCKLDPYYRYHDALYYDSGCVETEWKLSWISLLRVWGGILEVIIIEDKGAEYKYLDDENKSSLGIQQLLFLNFPGKSKLRAA